MSEIIESQIPHSDSFQDEMDARLQDLFRESQENFNQAIEQHELELEKRLHSAQEALKVLRERYPLTREQPIWSVQRKVLTERCNVH